MMLAGPSVTNQGQVEVDGGERLVEGMARKREICYPCISISYHTRCSNQDTKSAAIVEYNTNYAAVVGTEAEIEVTNPSTALSGGFSSRTPDVMATPAGSSGASSSDAT